MLLLRVQTRGRETVLMVAESTDGERFSTSPMHIKVKESAAGDLLYLELVGDRKYVYVGQPINITLEIWLKPYEDNDVRMDTDNMWRYAIDESASSWGCFLRTNGRTPPCLQKMEA